MAEVVVALDLQTAEEALAVVDSIPGLRWAKVGATLFVAAGPAVIRELKRRGVRVFLDLKWHDIPHQVAGAVKSAEHLEVDLVTVHALGGREMLQAAAAAASRMRVVAVTILTSHSPVAFARTVGRPGELDTAAEVARLAEMARDAGLDGVVTSPQEAAAARRVVGDDAWVVVPGIRASDHAPDDQHRIADPAVAVAAGASHVVVGRPVVRAEDPAAVYHRLCEQAI